MGAPPVEATIRSRCSDSERRCAYGEYGGAWRFRDAGKEIKVSERF